MTEPPAAPALWALATETGAVPTAECWLMLTVAIGRLLRQSNSVKFRKSSRAGVLDARHGADHDPVCGI